MRKISGFSLIELLVVVAIVAVLAGVAFPAYIEQTERGRRSDCKEFIFRVSALQERFFTENVSFATSLDAAVADGGLNLPNNQSAGGFCNLTLDVEPENCGPGGASCTGYTLTGDMITDDDRCAMLTYDNFGVKGALDSADNAVPDPDICWR